MLCMSCGAAGYMWVRRYNGRSLRYQRRYTEPGFHAILRFLVSIQLCWVMWSNQQVPVTIRKLVRASKAAAVPSMGAQSNFM